MKISCPASVVGGCWHPSFKPSPVNFPLPHQLFSAQTAYTSGGLLLLMPIMHHFNVNDNLIILVSGLSGISGQIFRALAKTEITFFASVSVEVFANFFSAPIRAQMTRCVAPEETGKVKLLLQLQNAKFQITF